MYCTCTMYISRDISMVIVTFLLKDARPLYDVTMVVKFVTSLVLKWLCAISMVISGMDVSHLNMENQQLIQ